MVEMITGIDISQEIFAIGVLRTLKSSLKHRRKHVLRSLQQNGDQALRYCPRRSPTSATFTMSVNIKFACLGRWPMIGDFYDECEHENCLPGTSGMLDFVFTCYQSLIISKL